MSCTYVNNIVLRAMPHKSRAGDDLCLWSAPLDLSDSALGDLETCLSAEERQRADRYYRPADRARFVAARGWLRHLLATQLVCTPAEIRLVTDVRGKPRVAGSALHFSAARSRGTAVFATSWRGEIGVDVEEIRPSSDSDVDGLTAGFFSPGSGAAHGGYLPVLDLQGGIRQGHGTRAQLPVPHRRHLGRRRPTRAGVGLVRRAGRRRARFRRRRGHRSRAAPRRDSHESLCNRST
jgi:hypothetical protein